MSFTRDSAPITPTPADLGHVISILIGVTRWERHGFTILPFTLYLTCKSATIESMGQYITGQ